MLLTLATRSLAGQISSTRESGSGPTLLELPEFARGQLQLRGLNVPASMLAGWSLQEMDRLRDAADKAGCPCLVLIEDTPLSFGHADPARRLAIACEGPDTDEVLERVATETKTAMPAVERLELNVLIAPHEGLTFAPDRLTDLIKRIGGFRIGSLPNFGHAAATGDPVGTLRKLAPYAGAVHATIDGFNKKGNHSPYDLAECVTAIRSVGFVNTLAIDYAGKADPLDVIERARVVLQEAIDADL
jgi:hypothetical protein